MSLVHVDASALVKLVLDETGSDSAAALWNGYDAALSSRLAYSELGAALAATGRNHDLTLLEARSAAADWEAFWASIRPVKLSADVEQSAGQLAAPHGLRRADAAHLASAVALSAMDLTVAVWDRPLHAGVLDGCERAAADLADEIVADWQCLSEGVAGWRRGGAIAGRGDQDGLTAWPAFHKGPSTVCTMWPESSSTTGVVVGVSVLVSGCPRIGTERIWLLTSWVDTTVEQQTVSLTNLFPRGRTSAGMAAGRACRACGHSTN